MRVQKDPIDAARIRTCWECVHHTDLRDDAGLHSWCMLLSEDLEDETIGNDCQDWEDF